MDTRETELLLARRYYYKPLPENLSKRYRRFFTDNIPKWLSLAGGGKLYTLNGTLICNSYERIVVGDYGAFVEFSTPASKFVCKQGQEYRITDPKYSKNVKYNWLTINDNSDIKIYQQKKTVTYADYKPDKYYVSVHEVSQTERRI